jgi:hypothetical protein
MKARKHPAPLLAFVNPQAKDTSVSIDTSLPTAREPRLYLDEKIKLLGNVLPAALVEIEALVDDYLRFAGRPQTGGSR